MTETKKHEVQILLKLIADKTGYTLADLQGPSRKRELIHVRRSFFAIARKLLKLSFEKIGAIVNRNHATVLYALRKHNAEIDVYDDYSEVYKKLYDSLNVLYIARTDYNSDYMTKRRDILITQRNLLNDRIQEYQDKIEKLNAVKDKSKY